MAAKPSRPQPASNTQSLSATPTFAQSRASSRVRPVARGTTIDAASEAATRDFVRRVLCPNVVPPNSQTSTQSASAIDELPPLTSSNEVDLQLYAFIGIVVKECVQVWYARFTPDQGFVEEIVHIIAHCTRAIEERARRTDLQSLILDDLPALLDAHVSACRTATKHSESNTVSNVEDVYHALRPHPALDRTGNDDEGASFRTYCHLVAQGLLAVLLPPGDLQNPCLRALVSEVSADLVLGNLIGLRFCDPSFVYDSVRRAADIIQLRLGHQKWAVDSEEQPKDRLSRFGLLSTTSRKGGSRNDYRTWRDLFFLWIEYLVLMFSMVRFFVIAIAAARGVPSKKVESYTTPSSAREQIMATWPSRADPTHANRSERKILSKKPIVQYWIWTMMVHLACMDLRMPWLLGCAALAYRSLSRMTSVLDDADGILDRLFAQHLLIHIFPLSNHLPTILLNLRLSLFPGNAFPTGTTASATPGQTPIPRATTHAATEPIPDPQGIEAAKEAQTAQARRAAAFAILNCIPKPLARMYFNTSPSPTTHTEQSKDTPPDEPYIHITRGKRPLPTSTSPAPSTSSRAQSPTSPTSTSPEEEDAEREKAAVEAMIKDISSTVLAPFENSYMNRHLALSILEKVIAALVPELSRDGESGEGGMTVSELLAERGVNLDLDDEGFEEGGFEKEGQVWNIHRRKVLAYSD